MKNTIASLGLVLTALLVSLALHAQQPQILLTSKPSEPDSRAAQVLQFYLQKMTGKPVAISPRTPHRSAPSVYIGYSPAAANAGFEKPGALGADDFFMQGKSNAFLIAASGDMGSEYGVYTLLEMLGCRKYSPTDSLIPTVERIQLPELPARIEKPAFPYRELWYVPAFDDAWARWHKLKTHTAKNREWGLFVHTFDRLCAPDKYFAEHPEYFAFNGAQRSSGQLCLSNDTVLPIVIESLKKEMALRPEAVIWSVSQNDNYDNCKCERCAASDEQFGSPAGTLLAFVNKIAAAFPDKIISTLAYQYTRQAPKNIRPAENVSICLCSIECNRGQSIETGCEDFATDVRAWSEITSRLMIWDYVVQFRSYISPFPNWHTLQPNLQFFQQQKVQMIFEQGSGRSRSEFCDMRAYLLAKLMWNPQISIDSVLNDFGNGYYSPRAWPIIQQYVHKLTTNLEKYGNGLWIYDIPQNEAFIHQEPLDAYLSVLAPIFEPTTRSDWSAHAQEAILPVFFAMLEKSKRDTALLNQYTQNEVDSALDQFVDGCKKAGIETLHEQNYPPETYRSDYKAFFAQYQRAKNSRAAAVLACSEPSKRYARGNKDILTDKLVGETDYRYNWLGFQGSDVEAVISVKGSDPASNVEVSFLQDQQSWVFFPKQVVVEISTDGKSFTPVHETNLEIVRDGKKAVKTIKAEFPAQTVQAVRVRAKNLGRCPAWHNCNGSPCWIFVDEVTVW